MKKILLSLALVGSLTTITGCSSNPQVSFDSNQNATQEETTNPEASEEVETEGGAFFDAEAASLQDQAEDYVGDISITTDAELLDLLAQLYSESVESYQNALNGNITSTDREFMEKLNTTDESVLAAIQENATRLNPGYEITGKYPAVEALHAEDAGNTEKILENTILRNVVIFIAARDYATIAAANNKETDVDLEEILPDLREQNLEIGEYIAP